MAKLHTPKASCTVTITNGEVEFACLECKESKRHSLPMSLDVMLQRGQDFSNYHRWCGEKSVRRVPKED